MMNHKPEEMYSYFSQALNNGDLEAICNLFEPEATMVPQPGQPAVTGIEAIRQVMQGFLAMKPAMQIEPKSVVEMGDIALLRSTWRLTGTLPDGNGLEMIGSGAEVVRRQPDGSWKYVIDHPWAVM